jgi:hypothetical protein
MTHRPPQRTEHRNTDSSGDALSPVFRDTIRNEFDGRCTLDKSFRARPLLRYDRRSPSVFLERVCTRPLLRGRTASRLHILSFFAPFLYRFVIIETTTATVAAWQSPLPPRPTVSVALVVSDVALDVFCVCVHNCPFTDTNIMSRSVCVKVSRVFFSGSLIIFEGTARPMITRPR